jgi:hypothetical protein
MTSYFMPVRGEDIAPVFDRSQHSTIRKYFAQLGTLFARCSIASDIEKKSYATLYVDSDIADTWEALPEYSDPATTFSEFKTRLFDIYNQTTLRFTISDLEELICDHQRRNLRSLQSLTEFHLRFNVISSHLLDIGLLSKREQSAMYLRVFDAQIRSRIDLRLQIQYPDHSPSLPHTIDAILEAARWILRDPNTQSAISTPAMETRSICDNITIPRTSETSPANTNANLASANLAIPRFSEASPTTESGFISTEHLDAILGEVLKDITSAVYSQDSQPIPPSAIPLPINSDVPAITSPSSAITSSLFLAASPSLSIPAASKTVQMRIQEIEDELCTLRAQCEVSCYSDPIRAISEPLRTNCEPPSPSANQHTHAQHS